MKLAEALLVRADLQKKIASLRERVGRTVLVQEGDEPVEVPSKLLEQVDRATKELGRVIFQVNKVNLESTLSDGQCLTAALAQRDVLGQQHSILQSTIRHATQSPERYGSKEIRWLITVDVAKLQGEVDELGKQLRELNAAIQEANWRIEVEV